MILILTIVTEPSQSHIIQLSCLSSHLNCIAHHPVQVGRQDAEEEVEVDLVTETFHFSGNEKIKLHLQVDHYLSLNIRH